MSNRRDFLKNIGIGLVSLPISMSGFDTNSSKINSSKKHVPQKQGNPKGPLSSGVLIKQENGLLDVVALDYTMPASLPNDINKIKVVAFNVELAFDCNYPGKQVEIYAIGINFNNKSIITSGTAGAGVSQAPSGNSWGEHGTSGRGENAQNGTSAGNVTIYCAKAKGHVNIIATGGDGGPGQDGGNGFRGVPGEDGKKSTDEGRTNGKRGGNGGNAGAGGQGGNGARGGDVKIYSPSNDLFNNRITVENIGGRRGKGGKPGNPGDYGRGGQPGELREPREGHEHLGGRYSNFFGSSARLLPAFSSTKILASSLRPTSCCQWGPNGSAGQPGNQGPDGMIGQMGVFESKKQTSAQYGTVMSDFPLLLSILAIQLDKHFIEESWEKCKEVVSFFCDYITFSTNIDVVAVKSACDKAKYVNTQMQMGQDFWGNVNSFAPNINVNYLIPITQNILNNFKSIEDSYKEYYESQDKIDISRRAAQNILTDARMLISERQSELSKIKTDATNLNNEIFDLSEKVASQRLQLSQSQEAFKEAVKQASGCSIGETFAFVSKIAVVVGSGGSAAAVFAASAVTIKDTFSHRVDDNGYDNIVKKVNIVNGVIADSINAFDKAKEKYNEFRAATPDVDVLTMNQEDLDALKIKFEEMISEHSELNAAKIFKADFYNYIDTVSTLQNKRMYYTNINARGVQLISEIDKLNDTVGKEAVLLSEINTQEDSPRVQTAMWDLYYGAKLNAFYALYVEQKAYNYWALADTSLHLNTSVDAGLLLSYHNRIQRDILGHSIAEARGVQSVSDRDVKHLKNTFLIDDASYPITFNRFLTPDSKKNHILLITIPIDTVLFKKDWSEIYVRSVRVYFKNAKVDSNELNIKVVHLGNSRFRNRNGKIFDFTHGQVPVTMTLDLSSNEFVNETIHNNLISASQAEENTFLGVSPFATWKIIVNADANAGLDLSALKSIRMGFDFFFKAAT